MTTRIIRIDEHGGPAVLKPATMDLPPPGPAEIRIRQTAISVNFHDIYVRTGLYRTLGLPGVPGLDAVGVVEACGVDVTGFAEGDRVVYIDAQYGAYAQERNLAAARAVRLPGAIGDAAAAASFLKALSVDMLLRKVRSLHHGETILVHAAAGGVGQLLTSWASQLGAHVIATVGSEDKARIARELGASDVIFYRQESVVDRVMEITSGQGVAAAYDAVGADTFAGSLASLDFQGHLVLYGQASGPVEPIAPAVLSAKSLSLTRPILFHYIRSREALEDMAGTCFEAFAQGMIKPIVPLELPLEEAARAHEILEARQSPGGIVLVP